MSGFIGFLAGLNKLIDFISWAVQKVGAWLSAVYMERRLSKVQEAFKRARAARTVEEKREAACAIEKTISADSDCDSRPNSLGGKLSGSD